MEFICGRSGTSREALGSMGVIAMKLATTFSIATNAITVFVAGPRVICAMADRGLLPSALAGVSEAFQGTLSGDRTVFRDCCGHLPQRSVPSFSQRWRRSARYS